MLTWNVTYHCNPGQREIFYEALCTLRVREVSMQEEGNKRYDYFFAAEAPNDLLLVETWTEPAMQEAHCKTETFAKLQNLKAQYCESVSIEKFNF